MRAHSNSMTTAQLLGRSKTSDTRHELYFIHGICWLTYRCQIQVWLQPSYNPRHYMKTYAYMYMWMFCNIHDMYTYRVKGRETKEPANYIKLWHHRYLIYMLGSQGKNSDASTTLHAYKYMCYLSCNTIVLSTPISSKLILSFRLFNQVPV